MTANRARLSTQRPIGQSDHVSARVAHRQILVECEDDSAVWQHSTRQRQQVDTKKQEMLKMHDLRLEDREKLGVGGNVAR